MIDELINENNTKLCEVEVSFDKFVQIFVNHRVSRVSESTLKTVFCNLFKIIMPEINSKSELSAVPLQDFLYFLENYGERISTFGLLL